MNHSNANYRKSEETKKKLLDAGIHLFARYGYDATTTRMIANAAGVNIATISFHFNNKETFYKAVLRHVADEISCSIPQIQQKTESLLAEESHPDKALVWDLICELIDFQLNIAIDLPYPDYLMLLYWEQVVQLDNYTPITDVVFQKAEYSLARLLSIYLDDKDFQKMLTLSRSINGGIISFAEHPLLYNAKTLPLTEPKSTTWVKETLRNYILNSIKTYHTESE